MINREVSHATLAAGLLVLAAAEARGDEGGGVPMLSDRECWERMPKPVSGGGGPLPGWARAVAVHLPRTTAALLELDLAHRTASPLDPKLRAAMRLQIARANRCAYSEAYALADARRAGMEESAAEALRRGDHAGLPEAEREALEFARKMTLESSAVSDAEFAALVEHFGAREAAAMVLLSAYGNFQDRLVLSLGIPLEPGEPLPPVEVKFDPRSLATETTPPPRASTAPLPRPTGRDVVEDDPEWAAVSYEELQRRLESQRQRPTRLPIPTWSEVERGLPKGFTRPSRIVWNLICLGYAPALAMPWETLMRTNGAESGAKLDRVFSLSLFWVVTRTIDCPYCMGHCDMNWEVAGLTPPLIAERTRLLAGDDWTSFPPEEQRAFALARKLTRTPWEVSAEDVRTLERDFGPDRAMSTLVYACRCNYMTRISNGFQLTLERDNVFYEYYNVQPPTRPAAGDDSAGR